MISFNRVLLATIWDKGLCPCPWCLVTKSKLDRLGTRWDGSVHLSKFWEFIADKVDAAWQAVYDLGKSICSTVVEDLLRSFSGVPTMVSSNFTTSWLILKLMLHHQNAFVNYLGCDFNSSQMLVVDLLHEFELGVWKALFTHLICLLHAASWGSNNLVIELDRW